MKSIMKFVLGIFLLIGILSCENISEGTFVSLRFAAVGQSDRALKSAVNEEYTFDSAHIVLEKIELKKAEIGEEVENEEEYEFHGPYVIDLLTGESDPELPLSEIESGIYTKLDAEMAPTEEIEYSFYLHGTYSNDEEEGQKMDFEFSYMQSEDFKIENPDGFEITTDQINEVLVLIDLGILMSGVDLSLAEVDDVDGIIRLNKESNRDLADIVESNLEAASELDLDSDENGEID